MPLGMGILIGSVAPGGSSICSGGHTAIWSGAADYVLPEGYPCSCGQTAVHYYTCPTCGHRKIEMRNIGVKVEDLK